MLPTVRVPAPTRVLFMTVRVAVIVPITTLDPLCPVVRVISPALEIVPVSTVVVPGIVIVSVPVIASAVLITRLRLPVVGVPIVGVEVIEPDQVPG